MATLEYCESIYFPNEDFICDHDDFPFCNCLAEHARNSTQTILPSQSSSSQTPASELNEQTNNIDDLSTLKHDTINQKHDSSNLNQDTINQTHDITPSDFTLAPTNLCTQNKRIKSRNLDVNYISPSSSVLRGVRETILEDLDEDSEEEHHNETYELDEEGQQTENLEGAAAPEVNHKKRSSNGYLHTDTFSAVSSPSSSSRGAEGPRRASIVTADSRKNSLIPQPEPIRIAVFGKDGVGKSALIVRLVTGRFIGEYDPTMEAVYHYQVPVSGMDLPIQVMDTAGYVDASEEGREVQISWGEGFLLVFSLTSHSSLLALQHIRRVLVDLAPGSPRPFVMVGNKADLSQAREVTDKEIHNLADLWGCEYFEVSAAEPWEIVLRPFNAIYHAVLDKRRS